MKRKRTLINFNRNITRKDTLVKENDLLKLLKSGITKQAELAELLGTTQTTVSRHMASLESRGKIRRVLEIL